MIRMNRNSEHTVSAVSSPAINLPMGSATLNYRSDLVNPCSLGRERKRRLFCRVSRM
jgi:hypothetical protein